MELGSEFHLDLSQLKKTEDTIFKYLKDFRTIYTDSGRSALRLLSPYIESEKILVPSYTCDSVIEALSNTCEIIFYPIDKNFVIDIENLEHLLKKQKISWLYLMHYFGSLQPEDVCKKLKYLKEKYKITIIEDVTHSIFSCKQTIGDYCIASLRKWFPIPDGGVLYSKRQERFPLLPEMKKAVSRKMEAMLLKKLYLTEEFDCNAKYRELFIAEEQAFDRQEEIYGISDMSEFLLNYFSVEEMCKQRKRNADQLSTTLKLLGYELAVEMKNTETPFVVPIYDETRDLLRKYLMEYNIFCAVHWPILRKRSEDINETWIGTHILSLPIDQRYNEEHINYLIECLGNYKGER